MNWRLLILLTFVSPLARGAVEFDPAQCDDIEQIAEELVELNLGGVRWQGGESKCLDQNKFKTVKAEKLVYGDAATLNPSVIVSKGRPVTVDVPTRNEVTGVYSVNFYFIGKTRSGQAKNVRDSLRFTIYSKSAIKTQGCARLVDEPETFAMREECR
jgi:hypothetical protein